MKRVRKFSTFLIFSFGVVLSACQKSYPIPPIEAEPLWARNKEIHFQVDSKGNKLSQNEPHDLIDYAGDEHNKTVPATCHSNGVGYKICTVCRYVIQIELPKLEHNLGNWEVTKEASFTEKGIRERKCSKCNYSETEEFELEVPPTDRYPTENYYGGYYVPISSWENGEDLKNKLHALISSNFTGLVYDGNWETNQIAEQSLTNFDFVNVIYSQKDDKKINTYGSAAGSAGWQREHAFCASLMTAYNTGEAVNISNSGTSRATDFHNLFASYGAANGY